MNDLSKTIRRKALTIDEYPIELFGQIYFPFLFVDKLNNYIPGCPAHQEWQSIYLNYHRSVIQAPRDHAKTTIISKICAVYSMCVLKENILITSKNPGLSRKNHRWIRKQFVSNQLLIRDFDIKVIIENERELLTEIEGVEVDLMSIPAGAEFLGFRADRLICDDILNQENTYTEDQRRKLKYWFFNDLINILHPGGYCTMVGTPRHNQDLLQELNKNKEYHCLIYDSIVSEQDKTSLWPGLWSWDRLMQRKNEIGTYAFNQNYRCRVYDNENTIFPINYLEQCKSELYEFEQKTGNIYIGCDFAVQSDKDKAKTFDSDYNVFTVIELLPDNIRKVLYIFRDRGRTFDQNIKKMFELIDIYKPNRVTVENNVFQDIYFQELVKYYPNIFPSTTGRQKMDLYEGVPSLSALFENKRIILPYKNDIEKETIDELITELNAFGFEKHDDMVMSLWLCELGIRTETVNHAVRIKLNERRSLINANKF